MFRDLMTLQERMNRLFEDALPRQQAAAHEDNVFSGAWAPAVDIFENENAIVLKADLPDVNPEAVDIRVEDNTLFLRGERKFQSEVKKENYHRVERSYGSFARSFALPHSIAPENITANYKNGVLTISMPKREESKPKQIRVNVAS